MSANKARGEVEITLGGKTYAMAPTFDTIQRIEQAHGGLVEIMARFGDNAWRVGDLVGIAAIALAGEKGLSPQRVGREMHEAGYMNFVAPVSELLVNALTGGRELEDEPEDAPEDDAGNAGEGSA